MTPKKTGTLHTSTDTQWKAEGGDGWEPLNIPFNLILSTLLRIKQSQEVILGFYVIKIEKITCFCLCPAAIFVPHRGTQTRHLHTNLSKTFLQISPERNIAYT